MSYNKIIGYKILALSLVGTALVVTFFAVYSFSLPFEYGVIASIFTFTYGFFLTTIFGFLKDKYLRFKELMAQINADIYNTCNVAALYPNKAFARETRKTLIKFAQSFVELEPDRYWKNQKYITKLYALTKSLNPKQFRESNLHDELLTHISSISSTREKIEIFGFHYLVGQMKWIYIIFTGVLNLIILLISASNPFLLAVGTTLVLILSFISFFLFDLDDLSYGEASIKDENTTALIKSMKSIKI